MFGALVDSRRTAVNGPGFVSHGLDEAHLIPHVRSFGNQRPGCATYHRARPPAGR
jgi:hypothetical protein